MPSIFNDTKNQHPPTVASRGNNCHFGADRCDRVYMESQENRENARTWYDSPSVSKSSNRKTSFFSMLEPNLEPVNFHYLGVSILQKGWPKLWSKQGVPLGFDRQIQDCKSDVWVCHKGGLHTSHQSIPAVHPLKIAEKNHTMEQYRTLQGTRKHIPPRGVSENHRLKKRQTVGRRICYMLVSRTINTHNNKSMKKLQQYNNSKEIPHYTTKPKRNLLQHCPFSLWSNRITRSWTAIAPRSGPSLSPMSLSKHTTCVLFLSIMSEKKIISLS